MSTFVAEDTGEAFTFDTVLQEQFEDSVNVTEHPIDRRAPVHDHIEILAKKFTIDGIVTASPTVDQRSQTNSAATFEAVLEAQRTGNAAVVAQAPEGIERLVEAVRYFERNRTSLFAWSGVRLGLIEDVAIERIEYTVTNVLNLEFTLSCKVVRRATSQIVDIPPEYVAPPEAKPIMECGTQSTQSADEALPEHDAKTRSFLFRGSDWAAEKAGEEDGLKGYLDRVAEER